MPPLRMMTVIGTRPEAIKLAPVILAARARPEQFEVRVVRTGQHRELVDELLAEFGLGTDVDLNVMQPNQDPAHVLSASVRGLSDVIADERPDWVLVQGDTTTTLAGALAAFYRRVPIGHVEAGLRSGDRGSPFPEEANRTLTTHLAQLHFAPTVGARMNLLREGIDAASIVLTGNTVIDALLRARDIAAADGANAAASSAYFLVTAHRRENHGAALVRICHAVSELLHRHPSVRAWIPMHPHPAVRRVWIEQLGGHDRALLSEPLGYSAFVRALEGATLVLTDSGGVQEECAALGKPVLVMRERTERPEAVDAGVARLVGTAVATIVETASPLLERPWCREAMARSTDAFGDGRAAHRILEALWSANRQR
jgi:UDP-N-acetylglucosamine 2-epimerase (non-hydrolysing)